MDEADVDDDEPGIASVERRFKRDHGYLQITQLSMSTDLWAALSNQAVG